MDTKIRVLKSTVFPTATYGCEAWTINKTDGKLITGRVRNEKVLEKVKINSTTLLYEIRKLKVGHFGHIRRHESLENHTLEAKAAGRRGRGRPMRRWEQDIQDWLETTTRTQAGRMAEDRVLFRKKIREATSYKGSAD